MKTNMINTNSIKTYICAVVMLLGMSVNAWGVTITLKGWDKSTSSYVDFGTFEKGEQPGSGPGSYADNYLTTLAWAPGTQTTDTSFPTNGGSNNGSTYWNQYGFPTSNYNGDATTLYAVYSYGGYYTTQPDVQFTDLIGCTPYDITPDQTGTGTVVVDGSACEDATVTFTATPGTGYAYGGATILGDVTDISLAAGDAKQFTMPDEDVILSVTFTAQSYDATLKPNGGSGSDQVVRVTYGEEPPTTLKAGGAVVVPTRTGYDFNGYYDVSASSGGTQYYSYKGNPKTLTAEELWDKTNDANLFARWIAHTLTITLDKGTGGTNDGTAVVDYGTSALGDIDHATNSTTGYHLDGYYTLGGTKILEANGDFAADNITSYISDGNWIYDDDVTLYAHWALNTYTVHFNKNNNDATGSMSDQEFTYGTAQNLTSCGFSLAGKVFDGWATSAGGEKAYNNGAEVNNLTTTNEATVNLFAKWRDGSYTDAKFSCADWTLTGPSGDIVFITSTASKTVRSQEAFHVSGSGLPHSTALTFTTFPVSSKFEFKKADGTVPATDTYGVVDADVYVFYTPDAGDTSDGLDELTSLTVSVTGEPRTATIDTKRIIGRHLPADFVIAAKRNNKWYALPDTMTVTGTPKPIEIAVDDNDNPSIAYTASTTFYGLEGPTATNISGSNGQYIRFTMTSLYADDNPEHGHAPLFGSSTGTAKIGKSGSAQATSNLSAGYWWKLVQKNTSITNPQDAKYLIYCANNDTTLSLKENAGDPKWGLYKNGYEELRLIPASDIPFTEAYFVEWGQHGGVIEVDATGIDATSVVAHLNGASSAAITLVETRASDTKNRSSKYNYTVNFGDGIDFAAAASNGAMLTLEWKKDAAVKAMSNIVVPKIIATSATMSSLMATDDPWSSAEVHVLPGITLEANAGDFSSKDVVINQLEIYPGATVKVTKGSQDVGTLKVRTLVLRNGWTRVGSKSYDVARLYVSTDANLAKNANDNVWYSDWYIDYDQYYPIAVPFPVATSSISYKNTNSTASAGVRLRYYSGALRATNIQQNQDANWVEYNWNGSDPAMPTNLEPSHGYIMTAKRPTGKAFSIIRMPLTFTNDWTALGEKGEVSGTHKDQVTVTAWGDGSTPSYAKGWNIIANPYMALHQGALSYDDETDDVIQYANIPDISFKEYDQLPIETTKLKPASAFLVQAPKTGTVTFGTASRKASAPSYRREVQAETLPTQKAYIVLANDEAEDMMGILVSDKYTAEYELNADLEKLLGDGTSLKTYMQYGDRNMAYVAINEVLAREWIPVTVRIPESGEYTYSLHEASIAGELEGIYLIDYTNGQVTNLIDESYSFAAEAGTINGRFAINAIVGQRETPTGIDAINAGGDIHSNEPVKFIWNDKVFILHRGVIYDSTGKRVREINR